jgi:two-component sensor histidine kinase
MKPEVTVGTKLPQGVVSAILNGGVEITQPDSGTKFVLSFTEVELTVSAIK